MLTASPFARYAHAMPAEPDSVADAARPIILCPLRFELAALARLGLGRRCDLQCCGPGAAAVTAWARRASPAGRPIILAGLAGALRPGFEAGSAHLISAVCGRSDDPSEKWRPAWPPSSDGTADPKACTIVSCDRLVTSIEAKHRLAATSGADLVDLESMAYAAVASAASWQWGIVRGVSDDASTGLPDGLEGWVDPRGRARPGRVMLDAWRRPGMMGQMLRLRRDSLAAMRAVGERIERLLAPETPS